MACDKKRQQITIRGKRDLVMACLARAANLLFQIRRRGKAVPDEERIIVEEQAGVKTPELEASLFKTLDQYANRCDLCSMPCDGGSVSSSAESERRSIVDKLVALIDKLIRDA